MKKIILLIIFAVILLAVLAFTIFYFIDVKLNEPLKIDELMAIVKKSPDYPDFLKIIKASNFDGEITEYYHFSPEIYEEKKAEWDKNKNESMKDLEQVFDTVKLTEDSYLVRLVSKTNSDNGLLALVDVKNKEPLVIVAEIKRTMGMEVK